MRVDSVRRLMWTAILVGSAMTAACAYAAPSVRLRGSPQDIDSLVGEWSGEYLGDRDQGRHGSISFRLEGETGKAQGDVLMMRDDETLGPTLGAVLSISFVRVGDGLVSGVMDTYWDPDRGTGALTTFSGRMSGNSIEGRFVTTYENATTATGGWWKVRRKTPQTSDR